MAERFASAQSKHFFVAAIALAITIWPTGFNLGAFGTIFFDSLLEIWVISLAALLAGLLMDRRKDTNLLNRRDALVLCLPSIWLLTTMLGFESSSVATRWLNGILTLITGFVAVPYILHLLMPIAMPELAEVRGIRRVLNLVLLTVLIGCASFALGYRNDLVMSCADFAVSGNAEPTNCRQGPARYEHGRFRLPGQP